MPKVLGLEYEDVGRGEAILFIHGAIIAGAFLPLTKEKLLSQNYRLIRYDRRGLGGSDRHTGPFSMADQASDAAALLRHLGVAQAHVVGHSYGGAVAIQLALDAPAMVRSLVVIEPAADAQFNPGRAVGKAIAGFIELYRAGRVADAVDGFMRGAEGPKWKAIDEYLPGTVAQAERDAAAVFEVEIAALNAWEFDAEMAKQISQPILYMIGENSAARTGPTKEVFATWVSQTEGAVIPGGWHSMHHKKPGLVAAEIHAFISRHSG